MKNTIFADADLNAELLRSEEYEGNLVELVIDADNTANQELRIAAGDASTTETIAPGVRNTIEIPRMLWNFGGATTATLSKNGTDAETITITFPAAVDVDAGAALNETETENEYRMDGSQSLQQQIVSMQNQLETFSMQTLDYILPKTVSQTDITDGNSNTVLVFEMDVTEEGGSVSLFSTIQFLATTTVTGGVYDDLNITGSILLDGNSVATILCTYRDGRQVLTIDYLVENLSKGNHTVTVAFSAAGGSMTIIQVVSAFMLAAKSTGGSTTQIMPIFTNGQWAPGVLPTGLSQDKMTEEAMLNGVEDSVIKYAKASTPTGNMKHVSELDSYFLSSYILCNGQYYAEPFYIKDGYMRKQATHGHTSSDSGKPVQYTTSEFWIPIKRVTGFNVLQYEAKTIADNGKSGSTDYNVINIGAGAIVNGAMQSVSAEHSKNTTWTIYSVDISSLPYVDYILLRGVDGSPAYRNIRLMRS